MYVVSVRYLWVVLTVKSTEDPSCEVLTVVCGCASSSIPPPHPHHRTPQVCSARMQDYWRKFDDAARRYLSLAYEPTIHPSEQLTSLRSAINCAILSSAGPTRSRQLASLYKDERSQSLPTFGILEKM